MKNTCFFMCYYPNYEKTARYLANSVKRFYPDIPVLEFVTQGAFDVNEYCKFHLNVGLDLFEKYDRVISLDPDEIMCNKCPDLFDDFDMGVVQNNYAIGGIPEDTTKERIFLNAGLTVCTNKKVWEDWMERFESRYKQTPGEGLNEQNALNYLFHQSDFNIKLLEFPDRVYGVSAMEQGYPNMYVKNGELWVKWESGGNPIDKKLCVFHAAGVNWKVKETGEYNWDLIHDVAAREVLKSYGT